MANATFKTEREFLNAVIKAEVSEPITEFAKGRIATAAAFVIAGTQRTSSSSTGAAHIMESSRSIMPPWPGSRVP